MRERWEGGGEAARVRVRVRIRVRVGMNGVLLQKKNQTNRYVLPLCIRAAVSIFAYDGDDNNVQFYQHTFKRGKGKREKGNAIDRKAS